MLRDNGALAHNFRLFYVTGDGGHDRGYRSGGLGLQGVLQHIRSPMHAAMGRETAQRWSAT